MASAGRSSALSPLIGEKIHSGDFLAAGALDPPVDHLRRGAPAASAIDRHHARHPSQIPRTTRTPREKPDQTLAARDSRAGARLLSIGIPEYCELRVDPVGAASVSLREAAFSQACQRGQHRAPLRSEFSATVARARAREQLPLEALVRARDPSFLLGQSRWSRPLVGSLASSAFPACRLFRTET